MYIICYVTSVGGGNTKQQSNTSHLMAFDQIFINIHERHVFKVAIQSQSHQEACMLGR